MSKPPEPPEGMNGDHQHLHQMIEWNTKLSETKFKLLFIVQGVIVTLGLAILGFVIQIALAL